MSYFSGVMLQCVEIVDSSMLMLVIICAADCWLLIISAISNNMELLSYVSVLVYLKRCVTTFSPEHNIQHNNPVCLIVSASTNESILLSIVLLSCNFTLCSFNY
jgi:hypothetical protein